MFLCVLFYELIDDYATRAGIMPAGRVYLVLSISWGQGRHTVGLGSWVPDRDGFLP
jgi:hypothetical protein